MVSIKDVARRAGVAISTVSKVLNSYPNVSEETKVKVNKAVEELNFVPNSVAAALSSKQSGRVALLMHLNQKTQAIDEINMQYIQGAIHKAMELNLDVITLFFSMFKSKTAEEITRYLQSQSICGLIIYGMSRENQVLHELVAGQNFKCVVVDAPFVNENTSSVGINQLRAQYDVAKKTIVDNNGKRILYIMGKKDGFATGDRLLGMEELTNELELVMTVKDGEFSELQARNITMKYGEKYDVIVCASDLMAIGAMKALTEMDIFRPVCGFDGIVLMGYVGMQMNTVHQDFAGISAAAMEELRSVVESIGDSDYRAVCWKLMDRYGERFASIPAGKSMHHSFVGGLLMHTLYMVRTADYLAKLYEPVIDRSLLLAGTLLHDFAKCDEFVTSSLGLVTEYSVRGQLLGHLVMGAQAAAEAAGELGVPEEKSTLLQHMLLSHHGEPEFGAAVRPMCAESELLSMIDLIDSRMEIYQESLEDVPAGQFSKRVFALDKKIYRHS